MLFSFFSIFDENFHLCTIDSNLIENGVKLYMSGVLYNATDDSDFEDDDGLITSSETEKDNSGEFSAFERKSTN